MAQADERVIVGVKGTHYPDAALWMAAEEARSRSLPLTVLYAHIVPSQGQGVGHVPAPSEFAQDAQNDVDRVVDRITRRYPELEVEGLLVLGRAHNALVEESARANLLVLGSRMRGPTRALLLGSVGAAVAAHARCPVIVVRGASERITRIVVGTDHSPDGRAAVRFGFDEAQRRDVPLRVVSSWEIPTIGVGLYWMIRLSVNELQAEAEQKLSAELAEDRERYPDVTVDTVVEQAHPQTALLHQATDGTLLVVGTRGHGGIAGLLLGSVSQALLHHARCPVAVVHHH